MENGPRKQAVDKSRNLRVHKYRVSQKLWRERERETLEKKRLEVVVRHERQWK